MSAAQAACENRLHAATSTALREPGELKRIMKFSSELFNSYSNQRRVPQVSHGNGFAGALPFPKASGKIPDFRARSPQAH
jgi:hypothetical protein